MEEKKEKILYCQNCIERKQGGFCKFLSLYVSRKQKVCEEGFKKK